MSASDPPAPAPVEVVASEGPASPAPSVSPMTPVLPLASRLQALFTGRVRWPDHLVGAAVAAAYVVWLLTTARSLGFPRDEGVYFRAGTDYVGWWRMLFERPHDALQQGAIDGAFSDNHEHPALMKTLFGVSWWFLHTKWQVFTDATTAYRFPAMCMAGAALWITYIFGARTYGRRAGLVAAFLLGLMPRIFFHAHLACFDVPIATMWLASIYAHWRAQETRSLGWVLAAGIVFGLTLETKHNAWILPAVVVPHALFVHRHAFLRGLRAGRVALPASLVSMAIVGPIVFLALWPYLWNDTISRIQWWFNFHLNHEYYNIEYFGRNYYGPPSPKSYLPVMVAATVPSITLILFAIGAAHRAVLGYRRLAAWARAAFDRPANDHPPRDPRETDLLFALSFLVAIGPFFLAKTPIFGATKHWLTAYPFLALFAGHGFERVSAAMRRALPAIIGRRRLALEAALAASVVVGPLAITAHSHPNGLSTYVPFVGGTAGGADLGLNRQFWGHTTQSAAEAYLNPHAPANATVFISDTTWDAWSRMQNEGRVRRDLRAVGAPHEAQFSVVQHELHMNEVDYSIWTAYGTDAPVYVLTHDGVPIDSVYRKP